MNDPEIVHKKQAEPLLAKSRNRSGDLAMQVHGLHGNLTSSKPVSLF